jgi:hypothetical protein
VDQVKGKVEVYTKKATVIFGFSDERKLIMGVKLILGCNNVNNEISTCSLTPGQKRDLYKMLEVSIANDKKE